MGWHMCREGEQEGGKGSCMRKGENGKEGKEA